MKKTFSISEAISFGWNTFKSNWKFWIISFLIFTAASGSTSSMVSMNFENLINSGFSDEFKSPRSESNYETDINTRFNRLPNNQYVEDMLKKTEEISGTGVVERDFENNPSSADYEFATGMLPVWMWFLAPFFLIFILAYIPVLIVIGLISVVLTMGYINLTLDAARNKQVYYKTILNQVSLRKALRLIMAQLRVLLMFLPFIFLSVVPLLIALSLQAFPLGSVTPEGWLLAIFAFLLFSIPGIILALKYSMVPFVLVDLDKTPSEAMKMSRKLTKNVKFKLLGFWFVSGLVTMLGFLVFGVGVIPASIVVSLAYAYVYNKIYEQEKGNFKTELNVPTSPSLPTEGILATDDNSISNVTQDIA